MIVRARIRPRLDDIDFDFRTFGGRVASARRIGSRRARNIRTPRSPPGACTSRGPCNRRRARPSRTFTTVNMPPISIGAELAEAGHHRQRVVGHRHFHRAHLGHAASSPSPCSPARACVIALGRSRLCSTPMKVCTSWPIAFIVWCDLWQWIAQSPGSSATNSIARIGADRNVGRDLGPARAFRHPAAVGAGHLEIVAVQVDRMVGHGEIADADAHAVALAHDERGRCRGRRGCSRSRD